MSPDFPGRPSVKLPRFASAHTLMLCVSAVITIFAARITRSPYPRLSGRNAYSGSPQFLPSAPSLPGCFPACNPSLSPPAITSALACC